MSDLEKGKLGTVLLLSRMPHILPHSERVLLFRKYIYDEKKAFGLTENACTSVSSTLIAVQR
jgi:ubiquitin-protein ligase E3 B